MLSILIPTFNDDCTTLVENLVHQASSLNAIDWEIIVGDDVSTNQAVVDANRSINALPHCRYVFKEVNEGRAAIRNFLAQQAQGEWLLLLDADLTMIDDHFLEKYIEAMKQADVVCGDYKVMEGPEGNLRYAYEKAAACQQRLSSRNSNPYHDFKVSNCMIRTEVFAAHPLDTRFRAYGYEDVFLGKELEHHGIKVLHIDAPLGFSQFETNAQFMAKTEEGLRTLCQFREELQGYSTLLYHVEKLRRLRLTSLVLFVFRQWRKRWRSNLQSAQPSLLRFKLYKLGYYLQLIADEAHPRA